MGWESTAYSIVKDVNAKRKEYKKKNDKDAYIQLMEDQLDLMTDKFIEVCSKLAEYEDKEVFKLNDDHKIIFKMFNDKHYISEDYLLNETNQNPEMQIAYHELRNNDYIRKNMSDKMFGGNSPSMLRWNLDRVAEILKFIHNK